jgi:c-type cytochrome biogenesis protein CcmF
MLGQIQSIEQFSSALSVMRTGNVALHVGLLMTMALIAVAGIAIWRKDERMAHAARLGQYAIFLLTAVCCALLYVGIFDGYYFVNYIRSVTENNEEVTFKIAALWASQAGSLLFWCFILTLFGAVYAFTQRHNRTDRRMPYTLIVLAVIQFFFFFIMASPWPAEAEAAQRSSPFSNWYFWLGTNEVAGMSVTAALHDTTLRAPTHIWEILRAVFSAGDSGMTLGKVQELILHSPEKLPPEVQAVLLEQVSDGNGMNPALHNYWIAIHPPMLYLGYVGFTVPFAYAVGSLLAGEVGEGWLKPIRLWTMAAWGFLTVGIALGGLWAYEILGWGGYWAWDPVENASLVPWLTATAFIHSVIVTERRGMLRAWSFALIIITYCMTIIGTFMVRAGIINSVHAFGATGDVDIWFYAFLLVVFLGSLLVIIWRWPLLKPDRKLDSIFSREGSFLFNNLIFMAIAVATFIITAWPLITETFLGEHRKEELGQDAYVMINVPLLLLILLLMGIGPALAWQRNSFRQMARMFAAPVVAALIAGVINGWWLAGSDLLIDTDRGDRIGAIAAWVRLTVQLTLWPICVFTLVCILNEFAAGAKARMRSTRERFVVALGRITLLNRRRYGGYIVHLGVLLISLGIYYSSFYEAEGTVIAKPGGFAVLEDELTSDKFLVVYEGNDRTASWDFLADAFGRDEERAELYRNMLRYVRMNPEASSQDILGLVIAEFQQADSEIPPNALARMSAAIAWGVSQRERDVVYEVFDTTLRVYPYKSPETLDAAEYLRAHDYLTARMFRRELEMSEDEVGRILLSMLTSELLKQPGAFRQNLRAAIESYQDVPAMEFAQQSGLQAMGLAPNEETAERLRGMLNAAVDEFEQGLAALVHEAVLLGAELPALHREIRNDLAALSGRDFAERFNLREDSDDFPARRFNQLKQFETFHAMIEADAAAHRNELVQALALSLPDERAARALQGMRPLSLAGLRKALAQAQGATAQAIEAEIAEALRGAQTVHPQMRIFYEKRTGTPKMNEPLKDPQYHRTLSRDTYFILQDAQLDGTATFRFFIKPQMVLGLVGLTVISAGTVLAFLPAVRRVRRRKEVQ